MNYMSLCSTLVFKSQDHVPHCKMTCISSLNQSVSIHAVNLAADSTQVQWEDHWITGLQSTYTCSWLLYVCDLGGHNQVNIEMPQGIVITHNWRYS